jgi:hypothetical protein
MAIMYELALGHECARPDTLYRLESGAIYCAVAILLVASASLDDEIFFVGFGIAQQLLVSSDYSYQIFSPVLRVSRT